MDNIEAITKLLVIGGCDSTICNIYGDTAFNILSRKDKKMAIQFRKWIIEATQQKIKLKNNKLKEQHKQ
jgi:hypothetical protein